MVSSLRAAFFVFPKLGEMQLSMSFPIHSCFSSVLSPPRSGATEEMVCQRLPRWDRDGFGPDGEHSYG